MVFQPDLNSDIHIQEFVFRRQGLRYLLFLVDILLVLLYLLSANFVRFLSDILTKSCLQCTPRFTLQLAYTMHMLFRALVQAKIRLFCLDQL